MHEYKTKIRRIVDGDTVDVDIDLGFGMILSKQRIRLYGIDTPENGEKCFYESTELGNTYLAGTMASLTGTTAIIKRDIYRLINPTDVGDGTTGSATESAIQKQEFIRPGHLIKIDDEIMLVRGLGETINHEYPSLIQQKLWVLRGVMGTEAAVHSLSYDTSIYIVSPKLKFPNGSKGKNLKIKLLNKYGHVDGIGITYKDKKVK